MGHIDNFFPMGVSILTTMISRRSPDLRSDFLTTGPECGLFEQELAAYVGAKHAVAVSNGSAALHSLSMALRLSPGDQIIVPALTFSATAAVFAREGADIVFADVHPDTGLMTAADLDHAIHTAGPNLKAVVNVHLNGQCEDVVAIWRLCQAHNLPLIDDACHALGTIYQDRDGRDYSIGSNAHCWASVFSFHAVKTITTAEGGAVTTSDADLYQRLRHFRNHGMTRDTARFQLSETPDHEIPGDAPWHYEIHDAGLNYRLNDLQAALGRSQLQKLPNFVSTRRQLYQHYQHLIRDSAMDGITLVPSNQSSRTAWHLAVALIDFKSIGVSRSMVMKELRKRGIGTQVHYMPLPAHPYYINHFSPAPCPNAHAYYQQCLSLPLHPGMDEEDVSYVVNSLQTIITEAQSAK